MTDRRAKCRARGCRGVVRVEEVSVVLRGPERVRTEVKVLRCPRCLDTVSAPTATQSTGGDGT